jgi:hypothetical protein
MDYVYPYTEKKPPVGEEVVAIIHSRSIRFGTYHVDYDICHVDENGNWHARLAGNFQGKRELLGVIDWDYINLSTEKYKERGE